MQPIQTTHNQGALNNAAHRDEKFAACYLGVSVETLRSWRKQNRGPRYRKIGGRAVRYSMADLVAFVSSSPSGGGGQMVAIA